MSAILVVDDEAVIRETLRDIFSAKYDYQAAASVDEAIAFLESMPFDVVVTDISLRDRSGVELLGIVRRLQPNTPIIVISGIDDAEYVGGMLHLGAFGYLTKPFQLDEVEGTVERALDSRRFADGPEYRRTAPRYQAQVEARLSIVLVFEGEQDEQGEDEMLMIAGYTHDISESGLGIIVPEGSLDEQTIIGATFHIVLGLETGPLDIEAKAARCQRLENEKGYLIGAQITNMNGRDRVLFLQYLFLLSRQE
jgi:DNA-binding response OmpR family regulator